MPRDFLPIDSMSLDHRGYGNSGSWLVWNLIGNGDSYESIGDISLDEEMAGTDTGNPMGVFVWKDGYTTSKTFYTTSTAIYEDGVSKKTGLGSAYYGTYFAPFGPNLFMTNGSTSNPIQKRNTSTGAWADITIPTHGATIYPKFLITFRNQLIAANIVTASTYGALAAGNYKHLVWWSSRGNGEAWGTDLDAPEFDGSNYIPIFDDSYEITGLAAGENCVFVFKEHAIYRLDGPDFAVTPISTDVGLVHPKGMCKVAGKIYFMSQAGLWSIDSASGALEDLSTGVIGSLWSPYGAEDSKLDPPSQHGMGLESSINVHFPIGSGIANRLTMAADIENKIICALYKTGNTGNYWTMMFYNIETKQFSFYTPQSTSDFPLESTSYPMVYTRPRTGLNPGMLATIGIATKGISAPHANEHKLGHITRRGHCDFGAAYVVWPFKFYDPTKRVSIVSVRPVFSNAAFSNNSLDFPQKTTATAQIYSIIKPNHVHVDSELTYSSYGGNLVSKWGDMNIKVAKCPMADMHAITISLKSQTGTNGTLFIIGFKGVEVEWLEGPERSA